MRPLRSFVGSAVRLYFNDGEIVEAQMLDLDEEVHRDVTYTVSRILVAQPSAQGSVVGATCTAPLAELARWEAV